MSLGSVSSTDNSETVADFRFASVFTVHALNYRKWNCSENPIGFGFFCWKNIETFEVEAQRPPTYLWNLRKNVFKLSIKVFGVDFHFLDKNFLNSNAACSPNSVAKFCDSNFAGLI